jgi:hypothetical protein
MRLPGRLSATTLGDLLGALHRERASGVLELIECGAGSRVHRVHFDAGLVEAVETPLGVARIGELLRREGLLGDEGLRRFLRKLSLDGKRRAGELLVEDRSVTTSVLRAALRRQLRERLEALFALQDAAIRFRVARRRSLDANQAAPLSPREFLHDRPRRRARRAAPANDVRRRALSVLGLADSADRAAVQRAFRKLAASVHPDRHPAASAEERARLMRRFVELSAAYHELVA